MAYTKGSQYLPKRSFQQSLNKSQPSRGGAHSQGGSHLENNFSGGAFIRRRRSFEEIRLALHIIDRKIHSRNKLTCKNSSIKPLGSFHGKQHWQLYKILRNISGGIPFSNGSEIRAFSNRSFGTYGGSGYLHVDASTENTRDINKDYLHT